MTPSSDGASQFNPPASGWRAATASATGSVHLSRGLPRQDAVAVSVAGAGQRAGVPLVAAVADGHGHHQHFRSATGAQLAVEVASRCAGELASEVSGLASEEAVLGCAREFLLPRIVTGWTEAVERDLERSPVAGGEVDRSGMTAADIASDPLRAYGATLLVVLVTERWVLCVQIGDGDIVCVASDGSVSIPVPGDPALVGGRTTSLCQPEPLESFRCAVIDQSCIDLSIILMATDGYGNAQIEDPWQYSVGRDLHRFLLEDGLGWLADHLPEWVEACASLQGSGDDTTAALLIGPVPPYLPSGRGAGRAGLDPTAPKSRRLSVSKPTLGAAAAVVVALVATWFVSFDHRTSHKVELRANGVSTAGMVFPYPPGVSLTTAREATEIGRYVVLVSTGSLFEVRPGGDTFIAIPLTVPEPPIKELSPIEIALAGQKGDVSYQVDLANRAVSCRPLNGEGRCGSGKNPQGPS